MPQSCCSKLQLRDVGNILTVNFRDWSEAIEAVEELFGTQVESNLVEFALEILGVSELLQLSQNVSKTDLVSFRSVNHQLTSLME
jgi:hypothetical protein